LLPGRTLADQIADDHHTGRDPDAGLQFAALRIEATNRFYRAQSRTDRAFGIVFMGARVAEIDHYPVAHVFGDETIEAGDDRSNRAMIGANQLPQILRVEPRRERSGADEVTEHDGQLSAFRLRRPLRAGRCREADGRVGAERCDGVEQAPAMPDQTDAQILQILARQGRQNSIVDRVLAERSLIPFEAEAAQPLSEVHDRALTQP
jgi:hypothetical protein